MDVKSLPITIDDTGGLSIEQVTARARAVAIKAGIDFIMIDYLQLITAKAENMLEGALKSLFAVAEAYPDLKANQNFLQLQQELVDTEDKIQASRRFYNGGVRDLNTKIQTFPVNIVAGMFGFQSKEFFEVEDRASVENPVEVQF